MDWAHEWTDEQIEALERRFGRAYSQAAREMREKLDTFLSDYARRNAQWMRDIHDGKATSEEWDAWKRGVATNRQFISGMVEQLSRDATRTNQLAFDMINDALPSVAAENANFAAYGIESRIGYDTHSFDLVDQSTIRRMMGLGDDGQILHEVIPQGETPNVPWQSVRVNMDTAKDVRWNRQKFNALLTQSILQGESIPNTAKRLGTALNMGKNMATRAARTAMTAAENAGRTDSYQRAKRIGIDLEQQWMATLDMRTRHSHRQLDGQHVPVGEKFKVDGVELEFPGDPTAPGEYVWNCRCTLVAWFPDIENEGPKRFSRLPRDVTYEQWKSIKETEGKAIESGTATRYTNMGNPLWSQLGPVDRDAVADKVDELLSSAHGRAATLWSTYEDGLKMVDPRHTGGAFYRHGDRGVHMNVQRSLDDVDRRGALSTWFHEFGHNIDYLAGEGWNARTTTHDSGSFAETLKREVTNYIKGRQQEFNAMLRSRDLQGLFDAGVVERYQRWRVEHYYDTISHIGDTSYLEDEGWHLDFLRMSPQEREDYIWRETSEILGLNGRSVPIRMVRSAVGEEITQAGQDSQLALGDIFEGATKGGCQDTYGHGRSYWDNDGEHLAKEAFAEFFSAECIYSERPEILDTMIERLPESYAVYSEIVEAMIGDRRAS